MTKSQKNNSLFLMFLFLMGGGISSLWGTSGLDTTKPSYVSKVYNKIKGGIKKEVQSFKTGETHAIQKIGQGVREGLEGHIIQGSKDFYSGVGKTITSVPVAGMLVEKAVKYEVDKGKEAKKDFVNAGKELKKGHVTQAAISLGKGLNATNEMVKEIPLLGSMVSDPFEAGKHTIQGGIDTAQMVSNIAHGNLRGARSEAAGAVKHFGNAVADTALAMSNLTMFAPTGAGVAAKGISTLGRQVAVGEMKVAGFMIENAKSAVTDTKETIKNVKNKDYVGASSSMARLLGALAGMGTMQSMALLPGFGNMLGGIATKTGQKIATQGAQKLLQKAVEKSGYLINKEKGAQTALKATQSKFADTAINHATAVGFGAQFGAMDVSFGITDGAKLHSDMKQLSQAKKQYLQHQAAGDREAMAQDEALIQYLKTQRRNDTLRFIGDPLHVAADVLGQSDGIGRLKGKGLSAIVSTGGSFGASAVGNAGYIDTARKEHALAQQFLAQDIAAGASPEQIKYDQMEVERTKIAMQQALTTGVAEGLSATFLGAKPRGLAGTMFAGQTGAGLYGKTEGQQNQINQIYDQEDKLIEQANAPAQGEANGQAVAAPAA